jgi:competence protein ComEA
MLQAWILRIKTLLQSRVVLLICLGFILAIGLSYYVVEKRAGINKNQDLKNIDSKPAAQESVEVQEDLSIVVDVSGAVQKPGLYKIDTSLRVGDALSMAGGISKDASLEYVSKSLNLAQKLEDTQKIYIPFEWDLYEEENNVIQPLVIKTTSYTQIGSQPSISDSPSGGGSSSNNADSSNNTSTKINMNMASVEELDKLSGIGASYASRIVNGRPYKDFVELTLKSGVPKTTLEKVKNEISF